MPDFDEIWYTDWNEHAEFKKRESGSLPPFSEMADAVILKMNEMLPSGYLSPDFDEIWYTDWNEHADFKKRKSGSVRPFSKMAAAAILEMQ